MNELHQRLDSGPWSYEIREATPASELVAAGEADTVEVAYAAMALQGLDRKRRDLGYGANRVDWIFGGCRVFIILERVPDGFKMYDWGTVLPDSNIPKKVI